MEQTPFLAFRPPNKDWRPERRSISADGRNLMVCIEGRPVPGKAVRAGPCQAPHLDFRIEPAIGEIKRPSVIDRLGPPLCLLCRQQAFFPRTRSDRARRRSVKPSGVLRPVESSLENRRWKSKMQLMPAGTWRSSASGRPVFFPRFRSPGHTFGDCAAEHGCVWNSERDRFRDGTRRFTCSKSAGLSSGLLQLFRGRKMGPFLAAFACRDGDKLGAEQ